MLVETEQLLTGSLYEPLPPSGNPAEESEASEEEAQEPDAPQQPAPLLQAVTQSEGSLRKEIPLFGSMEDSDPDESGIADFDYDKLDQAPTNIIDLVEGDSDTGETQGEGAESESRQAESAPQVAVSARAVDGLPSPRPRPQLPRLPSAPTRDSRLGVSNKGTLAVDAKASEFGEYMERLIETVKLNWDALLQRSAVEEIKSVVKLRFVLSRNGSVRDIEILPGTSSRVIGKHMCIEAVRRGVPYGPWPQGLVDLFGEEEDITFTFHYF